MTRTTTTTTTSDDTTRPDQDRPGPGTRGAERARRETVATRTAGSGWLVGAIVIALAVVGAAAWLILTPPNTTPDDVQASAGQPVEGLGGAVVGVAAEPGSSAGQPVEGLAGTIPDRDMGLRAFDGRLVEGPVGTIPEQDAGTSGSDGRLVEGLAGDATGSDATTPQVWAGQLVQ